MREQHDDHCEIPIRSEAALKRLQKKRLDQPSRQDDKQPHIKNRFAPLEQQDQRRDEGYHQHRADREYDGVIRCGTIEIKDRQ